MNILITSVGRRGYLVEYFKKALGETGKVHVGNSEMCTGFYYADRYVITPMIYDKEYIPFLLNYCEKNDIGMVLSLFDIDLWMLAKNKTYFEQRGIRVIVSDKSVIEICNDKWKTNQFCVKHGFSTPKTFLNRLEVEKGIQRGELQFPIIVKPRWGMGSIAVNEANNFEELRVLSGIVKRKIFNSYLKYESNANREECIIYQEKLCGTEYGVDVIHDLRKKHMVSVVKEKLAMRSGETDCARVVINPRIMQFAEEIGYELGHIGNLDMDVFATENDIYLLEMNARFGGGYPFSHSAGIDLPRAIICWLEHRKIEDEFVLRQVGNVFQKDIRIVVEPDHCVAWSIQ